MSYYRIEFLAFLAVCVVAGFEGGSRLLWAGRLEARGRIDEARAMSRRGGLVLAGASALTAVSAFASAGAIPASLLLGAAFAALLAGLSRKPRPTGWLAAILFLAGVLTAIVRAGPRG